MKNKKNENDDVVIDADLFAETNDIEITEEESLVENKVAKIKKELAQCRSEKQEYLDGWQRAKADYANSFKRFETEKNSIKASTVAKVVGELLPALDSLERAKSAGEMPDGFDAITKQLTSAFSKLGVEEIPSKIGEAFNPSVHEAFGQEETNDPEKDDTVSFILEKGWRIGDTVIRPTKVRVARYT